MSSFEDWDAGPEERAGLEVGRCTALEVGMSERVFAVVSVYDHPELLPHFLDHYTRLGVHRILVAVRSRERADLYDAALGHAGVVPASVYWFASERFADSDKADVEQVLLQRNEVEPDDYVMHLDLDEF